MGVRSCGERKRDKERQFKLQVVVQFICTTQDSHAENRPNQLSSATWGCKTFCCIQAADMAIDVEAGNLWLSQGVNCLSVYPICRSKLRKAGKSVKNMAVHIAEENKRRQNGQKTNFRGKKEMIFER